MRGTEDELIRMAIATVESVRVPAGCYIWILPPVTARATVICCFSAIGSLLSRLWFRSGFTRLWFRSGFTRQRKVAATGGGRAPWDYQRNIASISYYFSVDFAQG
jgi:hypothetical protein